MYLNNMIVKSVRAAVAVAIAGGIFASTEAYAKPADQLVLVPPASLPLAARTGGDSMFLRELNDGRMFLYIQRKQDTELAMLDVTDPAHIKDEGAVPFAAPETDDILSVPGDPDGSSVKDVRARVTNAQTGSTFLLTDAGLYVIRHPNDEWIKQFTDQAYENAGG